jgi:hypothetical protein
LWIFHLYVAIFQHYLHIENISLSWYRMVPLMISLIEVITTMTWLTVTEYQCYKWPHICSVCLIHTPVLSSFIRLCDKLRVTRQVPLVERKLPTFPGKSCPLRFLMVFVLVDLIFIYNHNRNSFVLKIWNSLFWFEIILVFIFYARNGHKCNVDWSQR